MARGAAANDDDDDEVNGACNGEANELAETAAPEDVARGRCSPTGEEGAG